MSLSLSKIASTENPNSDLYHIAKVVDGIGQTLVTIYYSTEDIDCRKERDIQEVQNDVLELVSEGAQENFIHDISTNKMIKIHSDIMCKDPPSQRIEKRIYNYVVRKMDLAESKYYRAPNGYKIEVVPRDIPQQVDRLYVAAPSGSGKSFFAAMYAINYVKQHPGSKVYIFSRKEYDPSLDERVPNLIRVKLDAELVLNLSKGAEKDVLYDYSNSLLIFDDFDQINDNDVRIAVQKFKNAMLELGRQYGISTISITHKLLSGMKSQKELQEASHIVCFPRTNAGECKKVMKAYCHFDDIQIKRILDEEGRAERWMAILRPDCIITQNYIKIIK